MTTNSVDPKNGVCGTPELNELSAADLACIVGGDTAKSGAGTGKVHVKEIQITKETDCSTAL